MFLKMLNLIQYLTCRWE